jgi:hypothetical protein
MTAVEWLKNELFTKHSLNQQIIDTFEHAKEMEKQQIINAKDCWFEDERDGEQYYNETYKKNGLNNLKRSKIMKNIYLLPTDKPSRLIKNNHSQLLLTIQTLPLDREIGCFPQNIYITSDEEIKEGEKCITFGSDKCKGQLDTFQSNVMYSRKPHKIILTTDQSLDGVQEIDKTFLEWFIKNPSCESVEVEDFPTTEKYNSKGEYIHNSNWIYKII